MAFRRGALEAIGGFDPRFRSAGDDVDVCWRLRELGWTLGYSPAATVWHHRRSSVAAYLKQQRGYGAAERLLAVKWRDKHGRFGHWDWQGRIYAAALAGSGALRAARVYHGVWGQAPFQSLYERGPGTLRSLPLVPEFQLVVVLLLGLSALGALWSPLWLVLPLLALALGALFGGAVASALAAFRASPPPPDLRGARWIALTALLHLLQPVARLGGRLRGDRVKLHTHGFRLPRPRRSWLWTERGQAPEDWLEELEGALRARDVPVVRGGCYDAWDLELGGSWLGSLRACVAVEEHGGSQLVRVRAWPRLAPAGLWVTAALAILAGLAAADQAWLAAAALAGAALLLSVRMLVPCGAASAAYQRALQALARVPGRSSG
jgi:hypothetical protein